MFDEATKIKQHLPDPSCDSFDIFPKTFLTKSFIQNFKHGLNLQISAAYPLVFTVKQADEGGQTSQ